MSKKTASISEHVLLWLIAFFSLYRSVKDDVNRPMQLTIGKNNYYNDERHKKTEVISLESFDMKDWYSSSGKRPEGQRF